MLLCRGDRQPWDWRHPTLFASEMEAVEQAKMLTAQVVKRCLVVLVSKGATMRETLSALLEGIMARPNPEQAGPVIQMAIAELKELATAVSQLLNRAVNDEFKCLDAVQSARGGAKLLLRTALNQNPWFKSTETELRYKHVATKTLMPQMEEFKALLSKKPVDLDAVSTMLPQVPLWQDRLAAGVPIQCSVCWERERVVPNCDTRGP